MALQGKRWTRGVDRRGGEKGVKEEEKKKKKTRPLDAQDDG